MEISVDNLINCDTKPQTNFPSWFVTTRKDRNALAKEALRCNGPAWQLFKMLGAKPCLYTLKWHNLFLSSSDADKRLIHNPKTIAKWKKAVDKYIKPPYFWCLEVGIEGEIHAHLIAGYRAGFFPTIRRNENTRTIKVIGGSDTDRQNVVSYLHKTPVPLTKDHDDIKAPLLVDWEDRLLNYAQALLEMRREGKSRVPQIRGYVWELE